MTGGYDFSAAYDSWIASEDDEIASEQVPEIIDDDDLSDAIADAVSNGEGRCYPDELRRQLAKRGYVIRRALRQIEDRR